MPGSLDTNNFSSIQKYSPVTKTPPQSAQSTGASSQEIFYSACAQRPPSLMVISALALLKHRGASVEAERKFCDLAAVLSWAKFAACGKSPATLENDPFAQLLLRPIDWDKINDQIAELINSSHSEEITVGLEWLVEGAGSDAWKQFSIGSDISQIKIGQPESWPPAVVESLLRSIDLVGADLKGAPLQGVDLSNLNLEDVNLLNANLVGSDLWGANLKNTNVSGAKFGGVDCVVPLLLQYPELHKTSDEFQSLLHPLIEAYVDLDKRKIPNRIANDHALETRPLQVYSNFCKWNLLPPMTRKTAEHVIACLNFLKHEPNWLIQYQDLANQLLCKEKDFKVFDFFFDHLRSAMKGDPKVAPLLNKYPDRNWKDFFIGMTNDGRPYAVASDKYRETYKRLRATPSFNQKQLLAAVSDTNSRESQVNHRQGMLAATVSPQDYL